MAANFVPEALSFGFVGHTTSSGVLETQRGGPKERVTTETFGRREGDVLVLEQDLHFADRPKQHRSWRIRKLDEHCYEATANDMVGVAHGKVMATSSIEASL